MVSASVKMSNERDNLSPQRREEVLRAELSPKLRELLTSTLPHRVIVTLLWLGGWDLERVADKISAIALSEALNQAERSMEAEPGCKASQAFGWCSLVKSHLQMRFNDFDSLLKDNWRERKKLRSILKGEHGPSRTLGETSLRDYFDGEPKADVARWCDELVKLTSAAHVCAGDEAFMHLQAFYKGPLRARILTTERGLGDCAEVERKAWTFARRELPSFNPSRETLGEFFRYCCDLLCLDPVAFERLMLDHGSKVDRVVIHKAVAKPDSDYDDILQEVWLDVLKKLPDFDPHKGSIDVFISNILTWHIKRSYPTRPKIPKPSANALHSAEEDNFSSVPEPSDPESAAGGTGFHAAEEMPDPAPTASEAVSLRDLQRAKFGALESYIKTVFADCDQPHQNIAFSLVQILGWKPGVIVKSHWRTKLDALVGDLETGLLSEYGEVKDNNGSSVVEGFSQPDVKRLTAPLRDALDEMECAKPSFVNYVPGDSPNDPPGDDLRRLAIKEFVDYELAARERRKAGTHASVATARKELEAEWLEMAIEEKNSWYDQVRANFISRWVNNVSRRASVRAALAKLKAELARIAEKEGRTE
jgi:DNA-directed RNA polymerase specialized sigma24 family protein